MSGKRKKNKYDKEEMTFESYFDGIPPEEEAEFAKMTREEKDAILDAEFAKCKRSSRERDKKN